MVFYGYHGAGPEERALGQRFVVDLEAGADLAPAGRSDDMAETVDYGELYRVVREVLEGAPLRLLEAVAEQIAAGTFAFERVQWVRVRIYKPGVAIAGSILTAAAVEITRYQQETNANG